MSKTLPAAFIIGFINDKDVRIIESDEKIITFEADDKIPDLSSFDLKVFDFQTFQYISFSFSEIRIIELQEKPFSVIYKIELLKPSQEYITCIKKLVLIDDNVKGAGDIEILKTIVEPNPIYPKENDKSFCTDWEEQEKKWFQVAVTTEEGQRFRTLSQKFELCFTLDNNKLYHEFLECPADKMFAEILKDKGLQDHGIISEFKRVYIGSEFCCNLFPSIDLLENCLEKACQHNLGITVVFPFIREDNVNSMEKTIEFLYQWQEQKGIAIELVINDWGMLHYLNTHFPKLTLAYGRMINKKLKDTKIPWKWGIDKVKDKLEENSLNLSHFTNFLQELKIKRIEFDFRNKRPDGFSGGLSFHFPYFQTNSSLYCPLNAECTTYNRTKQGVVVSCPQYCNEFVYLYPEHLYMVGKGNSIFGFNRGVITDPNLLEDLWNQGYDRLVLNL